MKRILFVLLCFISISNITAQVISSIPVFPTENDSIIVIFDASKGNQGLLGYTGDVYVHTGVTVNGVRWQGIIGDWGNDSNQPQLERIDTDLYKLTIGYPSEFYPEAPAGKITELCLVFRSSGPSGPEGKDVGDTDIFLQIYDPTLNVSIVFPSKEIRVAALGDEIDVLAISNYGEELKLFIDSELVATAVNDSISYSFTVDVKKKYKIKAIATFGTDESAADSLSFISRDQIPVQSLPEGVELGINYNSATEVTLVLFAPGNKFSYVAGDFTDWQLEIDYEMNLTPDSTTFWITISDLIPGEEYAYVYVYDLLYAIADPYSDKILDPWNDWWIPEQVYPNLKEYPDEDNFGPVSVLQTDQQPYNWKITNFEKPAKEELVIYELHIRDFVSTHSYQTLIDTLAYLQKLGVNAIELMPINEFEGNESWGYNPMMYFAPDKYYGTKNDLKEFIDAAHEMGIAVILDMVLNHAFGFNPYVYMYFAGYDTAGEIITVEGNPYFNVRSPNRSFFWGADFNHESPYTQAFVDSVNSYWLNEYNVDGFRFDFTKGFTNKSGDGWAYDQSRIDILKRMADKIWETDEHAYVILEHLTDNAEEKVLADYGMMLWGNTNYNYNEATMGYHDNGKSDFSWISYKKRGWNTPNLVGYMESHDEERLMFKNLEYGNSYGSYNITDLPTALNRIKLAAAFFFTIPGPKMIWQFGELGYDYSIDHNGRVGNKPIRWDYLEDINRLNLYKTFAALINLKTNYEVFNTEDFVLTLDGLTKRIQLNHPSMNINVIGNFDVAGHDINPKFRHPGKWYNYFTADSLSISNTDELIYLEPGEFHLYTNKRLPAPEPNILTDILDDDIVNPTNYYLAQNYPNPFNPSTKIRYSLPESDNVVIKVFDVLGREIKTLVNSYRTAGTYDITFTADGLTSGIYFYKMISGKFSDVKKFVIVK